MFRGEQRKKMEGSTERKGIEGAPLNQHGTHNVSSIWEGDGLSSFSFSGMLGGELVLVIGLQTLPLQNLK